MPRLNRTQEPRQSQAAALAAFIGKKAEMDAMLALATRGIGELVAAQRRALGI